MVSTVTGSSLRGLPQVKVRNEILLTKRKLTAWSYEKDIRRNS